MKPIQGIVSSLKMAKTAVVTVESHRMHPLYHKAVKRTKKYSVHNDLNVQLGDRVFIVETKPISKTKKWKVVKI